MKSLHHSSLLVFRLRSSLFEKRNDDAKASHPHGFTLIITLMLMGLLVIIGLGFLSLSSTTIRISSRAQARADAQANARFALMMALGELQSQLGPDQRISAPSAILDENPATANLEGVAHPHLTGVWNARDAVTDSLENYNNSAPDYSRDQPHFRRWLVSQAGQEAQQLRFALDGSLQNPISLLGSQNPALEVKASRVPVKGGSFAWWVGEEKTKSLINRRDLLARESNTATAELMASFGSPGA